MIGQKLTMAYGLAVLVVMGLVAVVSLVVLPEPRKEERDGCRD